MKPVNFSRIFGSRLFVWKPTGYLIIGILDKIGPSYSVIKAFRSDHMVSARPSMALGRYNYVDVERDELREEQG